MPTSAGLLPFRRTADGLEVMIAHPGGPFFVRKSEGAWSIVKGIVEREEEALDTARREFKEETGWDVPPGDLFDLGETRLKSGKIVTAWALEADFDVETLDPGTFEMDWRGAVQTFPEIDRVTWAGPDEARRLLNPAQTVFVDRLISLTADG